VFGGRLCVGRLHLLPMATTERICGCTTTSSVIEASHRDGARH
jgi:hypothetical protein